MRKHKIYLETTLFNYYLDSERDAHADTVRLFGEIKAGKHEAYTSEEVIRELNNAPSPKKEMMTALVVEYGIISLPFDEEAKKLSESYVEMGIIPEKHKTDGVHIAIAASNDMDFIISVNYKHIVKVKTETMTNAINVMYGYRKIKIITPMQIIENEND